jgi:hypothetical protein
VQGEDRRGGDGHVPAYNDAVATHLPDATTVYDHFYVIKLFNEKLSDLRRWLYHPADDEQKKVLKRSRWLLLKAPEHLDPEHDEKARLEEALKLNRPLSLAYYMKKDLRQFWEQPGKKFATAFLNDWIRRAKASEIHMLQQMAKTLEARRAGLPAYYDFPISAGPLEGRFPNFWLYSLIWLSRFIACVAIESAAWRNADERFACGSRAGHGSHAPGRRRRQSAAGWAEEGRFVGTGLWPDRRARIDHDAYWSDQAEADPRWRVHDELEQFGFWLR